MADYTLRVRPHYSGLFIGDCAEKPGATVMGRDHDEVARLAEEVFADTGSRRSSIGDAGAEQPLA